jgi:TolA-binding protein
MTATIRTAARALAFVSLAALAACQGKGAVPRISADSTAFYRDQVAALTTISSQKDSLMLELSETTKLITDVSAELATIRPAKSTAPVVAGEGVKTDARAEMVAKVRALTGRVRENEQRLAAARRRVDSLTGTSDSLRTALAAYTNTIIELQSVVESQKMTIQILNEQIASLTGQVASLSQERAVLTDTVGALSTRENEIFYVVGTKQELLDRGVITQEGGTRVLVVTRVGETLAPARVLDPAQFTRADKRTLTEIAMPKPDKEYRIVSRHDLAYAEAPVMDKGKFKSALRITSAQQFWTPSKYLIIVEN